MKSLNIFLVKLEKTTNDTITLKNGAELYLDTKYNEFEHRVVEAEVVSPPIKHDTGCKVGDTLYFHHLVAINEGQRFHSGENLYTVRYDPEHTINNQAIAYKDKKTNAIHPLKGWALLKPLKEKKEETKKTSKIVVVDFSEKFITKAEVAFDAPWVKEVGVEKGDVVGFKKNMDYSIKIEKEIYFRVRAEDLLYVEEK